MSITYRASASATGTDGCTFVIPASVQADDILIAALAYSGNNEANNLTGWTKVTPWANIPSGTGQHSLSVYWRRAVAGDAGANAAFTIPGGGAVGTAGRLSAWSGCLTTGSPINVSNLVSGAGTSQSTQVTTTVPNTMLVAVTSGRQTGAGGAPQINAPTGFTDRSYQGYQQWAAGHSEKAQAAAGGSGTVTSSISPTGGQTVAGVNLYLIALAPPQPTVTAISPNFDVLAGGRSVTITGTNFVAGGGTNTVTIKGGTATSVVTVNDTTITCVVPAGTVGVGNVVVTNNGGSGTLTNGFTYVQVKDNILKLVKGGVVSGNDKAATAVDWPISESVATYGGGSDLWGNTLTPADVNAGNFGVVLSALNNGGLANVDSITMTVYYSIPGVADPSSFLVALKIDNTRQIAQPEVYKLPRNDMSVPNDPNIDRATDDAKLYTSRYYLPSRNVQKTWRDVEFWLESGAHPSASQVPLQVWAVIDDGLPSAIGPFRLLDSNGNAAALRASDGSAKRVFFPPGSSVGHWVQLQFIVPPAGAGESTGYYDIQDGILRGVLDPLMTYELNITLILGNGEFEDLTSMRRTVKKQIADLEALADPNASPVTYKDIVGNTGYLKIRTLKVREVNYKEFEYPVSVAIIQARVLPYA